MELVPVCLPAYQQTKRFLATFVDAPNKTLTRGTSEVYKEQPALISCLSPLPTVCQPSPKKRRNSGLVSLRTMPVSANSRAGVKKLLPLARLPTQIKKI